MICDHGENAAGCAICHIEKLRDENTTLRARLAAVEAERDESRAQVIAAEMEMADYHEMRAALARAREVLREVDERTREGCPMCGGFVGCLSGRHDPTCTLKAALED